MSDAVNWSYGILNCYGVNRSIFEVDRPITQRIFGIEVSKERFDEVWSDLHEKLDGWFPKFNNGYELYLKNGSDWEKVDASEMESTLDDWEKPYEAWKDMPQEAIDYVKSLPEFDAEIFKRITGLHDKKHTITIDGKEIELSEESLEALKKQLI